MESVSRLELRPLDLAAVLDTSVEVYRQNFLLLAGIGAVVYVPFGLLGLLGAFLGEPAHAVLNLLGTMVLVPVSPLLMGALIHAVGRRYRGMSATLVSAWQAAFLRTLPLVVTAVMVGVAVMLGLLAFFVGAVVVSVLTTFTLHVVVLEDEYYDRAFQRSFDLTREQWPRVLGLGMALWLLQMVLNVVPIMLLAFMLGDSVAMNAFSSAWGALSNSVLVPLGVVPFVVLYFDIRVRQEALDLRLQADELGPLPPPREVTPLRTPGGPCPACRAPVPAGAAFCIACGVPQGEAS